MQAFLVKLVLSFVDKVFNKVKPTFTQGAGAGKLETYLRKKLKKEGWE